MSPSKSLTGKAPKSAELRFTGKVWIGPDNCVVLGLEELGGDRTYDLKLPRDQSVNVIGQLRRLYALRLHEVTVGLGELAVNDREDLALRMIDVLQSCFQAGPMDGEWTKRVRQAALDSDPGRKRLGRDRDQ
jgi:hypothetical protein